MPISHNLWASNIPHANPACPLDYWPILFQITMLVVLNDQATLILWHGCTAIHSMTCSYTLCPNLGHIRSSPILTHNKPNNSNNPRVIDVVRTVVVWYVVWRTIYSVPFRNIIILASVASGVVIAESIRHVHIKCAKFIMTKWPCYVTKSKMEILRKWGLDGSPDRLRARFYSDFRCGSNGSDDFVFCEIRRAPWGHQAVEEAVISLQVGNFVFLQSSSSCVPPIQ